MLDLKFVRDNLDVVRKALQDKGETAAVDRFSELDTRRRDLLREVEQLKNKRNKMPVRLSQKCVPFHSKLKHWTNKQEKWSKHYRKSC
jgi:seryl-tRNA synthetase